MVRFFGVHVPAACVNVGGVTWVPVSGENTATSRQFAMTTLDPPQEATASQTRLDTPVTPWSARVRKCTPLFCDLTAAAPLRRPLGRRIRFVRDDLLRLRLAQKRGCGAVVSEVSAKPPPPPPPHRQPIQPWSSSQLSCVPPGLQREDEDGNTRLTPKLNCRGGRHTADSVTRP